MKRFLSFPIQVISQTHRVSSIFANNTLNLTCLLQATTYKPPKFLTSLKTFDAKFSAINKTPNDSTALKELKLKLEAKDLSRPGNIAQYEFCGQLEIVLAKSNLP